MVTLVVFHHVADYAVWKTVFDEHETVRRRHGQLEHRVFRSVDNTNRVVVHNDFASEEAARSFMADPSLAAAMERAGVTDEPWLGVIERVEQKRYAEGDAAVTLAVHHRVRDYESWKRVFDEHESVRRRYGQIEHRIYHPVGDPLQLVVHNDFPTVEAADPSAPTPACPKRWHMPASRVSPVSTWPRSRSARPTSLPDDGARPDRRTRTGHPRLHATFLNAGAGDSRSARYQSGDRRSRSGART